MTDAATGADASDDRQHDVLGGHARRRIAVDADFHGGRPRLRQRLARQHVLHLGGADAEGQRAESTVRRGVAVTADHGHAGQRETLLGADDVHDALARIAHRVQRDVELVAVRPQHLHLLGRDRVGNGQMQIGGGDVVVLGRHGQVRAAHGAPRHAQAVEGLRRGDLMDEVQVDIEQIGLPAAGADDMAVPDLLAEGARTRRGGTCHVLTMDPAGPSFQRNGLEGPGAQASMATTSMLSWLPFAS